MGTTGIRVEMPNDIHKILSAEQKHRKELTGKTVPLSNIVFEYFSKGLESKLAGLDETQSQGNVCGSLMATLPEIKHKALEIAQKEVQLEGHENKLMSWDRELHSKENELRNLERNVYEQLDELYEKKDELAEEKERIRELKVKNVDHILNTKILTTENERKDTEIRQLQEQVNYLKDRILKMLDKLGDKINDKPDKNILTDYILPILPTVASIAGSFITNKNLANHNKKFPLQDELEDIYCNLGAEDKEQLTKILKESVIKKFNLAKS